MLNLIYLFTLMMNFNCLFTFQRQITAVCLHLIDGKKQFKAFSTNFAKNQPVKIGLKEIEKL